MMISGVSDSILKLLILSVCLNAMFTLTIIVSRLNDDGNGVDDQPCLHEQPGRAMQALAAIVDTPIEEEVKSHLRSQTTMNNSDSPGTTNWLALNSTPGDQLTDTMPSPSANITEAKASSASQSSISQNTAPSSSSPEFVPMPSEGNNTGIVEKRHADMSSQTANLSLVATLSRTEPATTITPTTAAAYTDKNGKPYKCSVGSPGTMRPILTVDRPHIMVGVLIRNRQPYVELFAKTLALSIEQHPEWRPYIHIWVFDDSSTAFTLEFILEKFPTMERLIHVHNSALGRRGDGVTDLFRQECIESNFDLCLTGDSDTALHPDWIPYVVRNMNKTDGHLTLYNSCCHDLRQCVDELCEKATSGSALSVFTRNVLEEFECNLERSSVYSFDWIWSWYMGGTGRKLYSTNPSMGEHLGIQGGSNGGSSMREQSRTFDPFVYPQPMSSLLYLHLEARRATACNTSKLIRPANWTLESNLSLSPLEMDYFFPNGLPQWYLNATADHTTGG